jgi:hypothetical protein
MGVKIRSRPLVRVTSSGVVVAICLVTVIVACQVLPRADYSALKVRTIFHTARPIPQRLEADDEVVIVVRDEDVISFEGKWTAENVVQHAVGGSDLVAVIHVSEVDAAWVEEQTWIHTRVFATIDRLMRSGDPFLPTGGTLEVHAEGGELMVGRVLVKAGTALNVKPQERYLAFVDWREDTGEYYFVRPPARVVNGKLSSKEKVGPPNRQVRDPLDGLTLARVAEMIRRYSQQ